MPLALLLASMLAAGPGDPNALAILSRSRDTQATYALYVWNRIHRMGEPVNEEWAAEFHRGYQHRVETPKYRIIADCATNLGYVYDVDKGSLQESSDAGAVACGVSIANEIVSVEARGSTPSAYGQLDVIRVVDSKDERFYAVDARGILVRTSVFPASGSSGYCVQAEPIAVSDQLPAGEWFTPESLKHSAVPTNYRKAIPIEGPSVSGQPCR
jgi:hypothetical protein